MKHHWCENLRELIDFIAIVVLSAPNDFAKCDWLQPDEQLNLERAFEELEYGLSCAAKEVRDERAIMARKMLQEAYADYVEGKTNSGAWKLQELSELLEHAR